MPSSAARKGGEEAGEEGERGMVREEGERRGEESRR
jgi:hypothetical protein